jgi:hypothetical protein
MKLAEKKPAWWWMLAGSHTCKEQAQAASALSVNMFTAVAEIQQLLEFLCLR